MRVTSTFDQPPPAGFSDPSFRPKGSTMDRRRSSKADDPNANEREIWDKPIEFLFSCLSMSVGLGNVWRFPFTALENGGGAFLIPYLIVLFLIGKPIYFLELAIGQFSSSGQVKVWRMSPMFKGVGYVAAYGTMCLVSYYCYVMAITVFYFFASFSSVLPWTICNPSWGVDCNSTNSESDTTLSSNLSGTKGLISKHYFEKEVLQEKDDISDGLGVPEWRLTLCLLASWLVIFGSLVKGVRSSGKVAYFTALLPYVVLIIFLIHGLTLEGSVDGILFFITPQWGKITESKVWLAAVNQCFFSLSTGFGPIIMFASYNPFRHNVYRDALILSLMDTFTSLLAGFTIFAILGYLAHDLNIPIQEVAAAGPSLAFVSYPTAISKFDFFPQVFALLFFLMLFTLGVGSATSFAGSIITIIHDQFPKRSRLHITAGLCFLGFLSGLMYTTPGGQFMLTLVDYFGAGFVIIASTLIEVIGIAWVYGLSRVCRDIEFMLDIRVGFYWKLCWGFFVPVGLSVILIYSLATADTLRHEGKDFPTIALVCGWSLAAVAVLLIPAFALHTVLSMEGDSFKAKFQEALKPSHSWGPKSSTMKEIWSNLPPAQKTLASLKKRSSQILDRLKRSS